MITKICFTFSNIFCFINKNKCKSSTETWRVVIYFPKNNIYIINQKYSHCNMILPEDETVVFVCIFYIEIEIGTIKILKTSKVIEIDITGWTVTLKNYYTYKVKCIINVQKIQIFCCTIWNDKKKSLTLINYKLFQWFINRFINLFV